MPRPDAGLFLAEEVHAWRLLDELAVAAYWIGRFEESKTSCEQILHRIDSGVSIPPEHIKRVKQNLAFANAKLDELAG